MAIFNLRDKVVVMTGASSGIGAALAQACARRGAKVTLAARTEARLLELQREITRTGGDALAVPADITREEDIQRMMEKTLERWGRVDVLVNNAGYGLWGTVDRLPLAEVRKNFETNVFAAIACCQAVLPQFRKQKSGLIVNVESVVALRAMPNSSCYCATKHALHAFSESIRVELAGEGIRVLSVCPGLIRTSFHEHRVEMGPPLEVGPSWLYISAEKCAARIIRAMEQGRSRLIVTGHARFLAMAQRIAPRLLDRLLTEGYRRMLGTHKSES